jgi:hypothetical protein
MAILACLDDVPAKQLDPIKQLVVELLVSYGGIAGGAAILSEGFSKIFPKVCGKENRWTFVLTFVLGFPAKYLFPAVYGQDHLRSWVFHGIVLLFVGVSAAVMRERLVQKFSGFFSSFFIKDAGVPPAANPPTAVLPPQDPGPTGSQGGGK